MNIPFKNSCVFCLFSLLTALSFSLVAQPSVQWDKTYGGSGWESLEAAFKTEDGGFLIIGSSDSPRDNRDVSQDSYGGEDYFIIRIDSLGNKLWDKRYGSDTTDRCFKAIQNQDGYLLIGTSASKRNAIKSEDSRGGFDYWLVQIAPDGTKRWDKTYGGSGYDQPHNAVVTDDGGYLIIGHSDSPISGDKRSVNKGETDIWLLKIDRSGNYQWDKTLGGSKRDEYPYGFVKVKDGDYVFVCESLSNSSGDKSENLRGDTANVTNKDLWLVKIDKNGQKLWDKAYGSAERDEVRDLIELQDGSLLFGGNSMGESGFDKSANAPNYGFADFWVIKTDKNGRKVWDKTFGGNREDYLIGLEQNKTGYIMMAGQSKSDNSGNKEDSLRGIFDFWLVYMDEKGDKIWDQCYGGAGIDVAFKMVRFQDGAYLICGLSNSDIGGNKSENARGNIIPGIGKPSDMWVIKIKCIFELALGDSTQVCQANSVTLDATIPNCRNCLYEWTTGATTASIIVSPTQTQRIGVKVIATNACTIKDDVVLKVIPSPEIAAFTIKPPTCHNGVDGRIALDSARGGSPPYFLVIQGDTFPRKFFIDNLKAGDYQIALVDRKGCKLEKLIAIPNPTPFELKLPDSRELNFGDSFRLTVSSNRPLSTYNWSDRRLIGLNPWVKPFDSYTYSLTATDSLGCIKIATTQLTVRRDNLYFAPNLFSPNGDTVNDYFVLFGNRMVVSIDRFKVFNRAGHLMYQIDRIFPAAETAGWDGRFRGKDAPSDVYVFVAEVTYIDGRTQIIKGDFHLMR
jgi:gliding motility-associated-like protein